MDYKYIEQLLERYWQAETSLEEEEILRTFFSQKDVPTMLLPYRDLFVFESKERETNELGADFDERLNKAIGYREPVKARTLSLAQRLKPLFKAAAIVAVIITMGNAIEAAFNDSHSIQGGMAEEINSVSEGAQIAQNDTITIDSLKNASQR